MHNLYAIFVKLLNICKQIAGNLVNESGFDYFKEALPKNKTLEQQQLMLGHILEELKETDLIVVKGKLWYLKL